MGLISFELLGELNERFATAKDQVENVRKFIKYADEFIQKDRVATSEKMASESDVDTASVTSRSMVLKQLRGEINKIDKQMEQLQGNREKLLQAVNALETLSLVSLG
jgi:chromosome segregation ATPase